MNLEGQKKYVLGVADFLLNHILSMKNVNRDMINIEALSKLCFDAACDMLYINYHYYGNDALFDEYSLEQIKDNSRVGEYQAYVDEFILTKISITRFGKSDLSDLQIQLIGETDDIVVVIHKFDEKIIVVKDGYGHELRYQKGEKSFYDGEKLHTILDEKDFSLKSAFDTYDLFKSNGFSINSKPQQIEENISL